MQRYRKKNTIWKFLIVISLTITAISFIISVISNSDTVYLNNVTCIDYEPIENTNYTNVIFKDENGVEYELVIFSVYTYNYAYLKKGLVYDLSYEEKNLWKPDNLIKEIQLSK